MNKATLIFLFIFTFCFGMGVGQFNNKPLSYCRDSLETARYRLDEEIKLRDMDRQAYDYHFVTLDAKAETYDYAINRYQEVLDENIKLSKENYKLKNLLTK